MQRQFGANWVVEATYAGSYSDRISIARKLEILPEQYWASGTVRNDAVANLLNANVTNPFRLANFASLEQTSPLIYQDMRTQGFYASATIRRHQLLRPLPHMNNGLTNNTVPDSLTRTHEFQLNVQKRFANSFNLSFGCTAMKVREANLYYNEWDAAPSWRTSNSGRPHRVVGTGLFKFPFGKGKRFGSGVSRPVDLLIGGWQAAATYEFQPGALLDWGNPFFYGEIGDITKVDRTFDTWFNTANFERTAARGSNAFHRRVFPTRVPDLRADMTNQWNANMAKNVRLTERVNLRLRLDVLDVQNRSQMAGPNVDPFSTNFGKIISQRQAVNRWLQVQARLTF